jgi:hypothetical protein
MNLLLALVFFTQFLDEAFGPETLRKKEMQIYGKGSWKISHRHIFNTAFCFCGGRGGPEGSA